MKRTYWITALIAFVVTVTTYGLLSVVQSNSGRTVKIEHIDGTPAASAVYRLNEHGEMEPLDFTKVADRVMDAVVHIRTTASVAQNGPSGQGPFEDFFRNDPLREFFGRPFESPNQRNRAPLRMGQGSGVLISPDGYIVTNNHVVADADDLEVTLHDNRSYKATLIGTDPTTDLALIRIKEKELPTLPFVNSDNVKVGEWVMAVGNPFNLTSTVTAGIVSAKGRNINILREQFAVESFIQTDAAINPGNSGGALVNLQGGLIGINTAIASPTGTYSGYGFAVPANIVQKVVEDLLKYGVVQRGVLGVMIRTVDGKLQKEMNLDVTTGAYVDSLLENSAAAAAGIRTGDVIVAIDGTSIENSPKLQETIARHRPGDAVQVQVNRKGSLKTFEVTLNNRSGDTRLVKKEHRETLGILGADFESLDEKTARELDIDGGVLVKNLNAGKLRRSTNMREGFIITKVDGKTVKSVDELAASLKGKTGGVMLEGVYKDAPGVFYYAIGL
ncbi:MAG: Do family serine endopeptidase [Lewinellaceae bacterium]|nr:Do family serine endopeptidase [Lewinellaceae bacterium]